MSRSVGPNGFGFESTAEEVTEGVSLDGQTILVTGCNSGLGLETVRVLALRGAQIIAAARTAQKASGALDALGINGFPVACELSSLGSVRAAVATIQGLDTPLDAIVTNAGIMALQNPTQMHGVELQLLTNHVGHFALVTGLLANMSETGRAVIVSSGAHRFAPESGIEFDNIDGVRDYSPWKMYGQSKLANIYFARSLARRFGDDGRTANSLHPGVIQTNLQRHLPNPDVSASIGPRNMKTVPQGAATQVYLAAHPDGGSTNGLYFSHCNPAETTALGHDDELAERLWAWTEEYVASH